MKLQDLKVGDRFKYIPSDEVWEVIGLDNELARLVSTLTGKRSYGYNSKTLVDSTLFEYLGNFNKADNFETLYNLFNE